MKSVCVVGLGYIGLPTAIVSADAGFQVIGFDIDSQRVERINAGDPVIEEPELAVRLRTSLQKHSFQATSHISHADYFIICVPTPFAENKKADLSYVWHAADVISAVLKKGDTIILESTVPVGTTDMLAQKLEASSRLKEGADFFVVHCPERVLPGNIFHELSFNPRILGGVSESSMYKAREFYRHFVKAHLYLTNARTAEMIKLVENSSRDVLIAFANQVADMAYKAGLNPFEVIELANKHPRVHILYPSCGVGGHCIAVDPWFLVQTFPEATSLLKMARMVNDQKPDHIIHMIRTFISGWYQKYTRSCKVLVLGLTYKPDIDDIRESPALYITQQLLRTDNCDLLVCEPHLDESYIKKLEIGATSLHEGLTQCDLVLCLVKHSYFKTIDKSLVQGKVVFDFCGLFYQSTFEQESQELYCWPTIDSFVKPIIDHMQENIS